jgi:hypothetical protein
MVAKHDIMVAPMRDYIEDWLRKSLIKFIEPEQQEIVATVMPPQTWQASTKEAPSSKKRVRKNFHHSDSSSNLILVLITFLLQSFVIFPYISQQFVKPRLILEHHLSPLSRKNANLLFVFQDINSLFFKDIYYF